MSTTPDPRSFLPNLPPGRAYRYHVMVKPAGALCNLDCGYCFYLHKSELLNHQPNGRISPEVLEQHIRQYIQSNTGDEVVFSWQGGEPTVMGLPFFERIVELQRKYRRPGQRIENDLQTNGLLLDDRWARFLRRHGFHVGLSIDGPRELHDSERVTKGGQPTFDKVMEALDLLRRHEVSHALLCVVHRRSTADPRALWRFFVDELAATRIQLIPCVEPRGFKEGPPRPDAAQVASNPDDLVTPWSVRPAEYGRFLCEIWGDWMQGYFGQVHVNLFETAVAQALGLPAQMCVSAPICGKALALEHDGSLYSCDHFVYPEHRLGDIRSTHEGDLAFSRKQVAFGLNKRDSLPSTCLKCPNLSLCWGECPKNRLLRTETGEAGLSYLCEGLMAFYDRVRRDLPEVRRRLGVPPAPVPAPHRKSPA